MNDDGTEKACVNYVMLQTTSCRENAYEKKGTFMQRKKAGSRIYDRQFVRQSESQKAGWHCRQMNSDCAWFRMGKRFKCTKEKRHQ